MKKNAIVVFAGLLFAITPVIAFCENRNLVGKGSSFETKSIRMKLYKDAAELSQFPEWPEINAVAVPLVIDESRAFHGRYSLKMSPSSFQRLKSGWLRLPANKKTFTLSCYLCADRPGAQATLCMQSLKKKHQKTFPVGASWERHSFTASFEEIPGSELCCSIYFSQKGQTVWIDGIQLEPDTLTPFTAYPKEITLVSDRTNNLFFPNENIRLKAEVYSDARAEPCLLIFQVNNWKGERVLSGEEKIMTEKGRAVFFSLDMGSLPRGWYSVTAALADGASQKIIDNACIFISVIKPSPPLLRDSFFGLHNHAFQHQFYSTLDILGPKWQRVFDSFLWSVVEPSKGKWRFPDRQVEDSRKHGQEILGVLHWRTEFNRCPAWGEFTESSGGSWRSKWPIPRNLDAWEEYVFRTVEHFKGKVDYWEIINEPNGWMSADEYLPLLKRAYKAAKQANPNCTVAGICTTADRGINLFAFAKEVIEKGGLDYCDVVSYHPYSRTPEEAIEWTETLKKLISQYSNGRNIPLWNTESGWSSPSCYEDMRFNPRAKNGIRTGVSSTDVASYLVRMHVIMKSLGVEKFFYFNGWTRDLGVGIYSEGDTANLVNFDDSPSLALPAYNAMVDILGGANFAKMYRSGDGFANACLFASNNKSIAVAWNSGEEKEYKVSLPTDIVDMQVYDIMGRRVSADKEQTDRITFVLKGVPLYIIVPFAERQKLEKAFDFFVE